jgi:hypothetical protein
MRNSRIKLRNNQFKYLLWHVDLFLGNDRGISNYIQQPLLSNGSANMHISMATRQYSSNGRDFLYVVCAEML